MFQCEVESFLHQISHGAGETVIECCQETTVILVKIFIVHECFWFLGSFQYNAN